MPRFSPEERTVAFSAGRFTVAPLSRSDLTLVRTLNDGCADFYLLQNGVPPAEREALDVFEQVPAGHGPAEKLVLGVFEPTGTLAGLVEILRGYRTASDWYVGLLLLLPRHRGHGFGSSLHHGLAAYARQNGVRRLLLAVLETNEPARRFWERLGYRPLREFPPRAFGDRWHALTEYGLLLLRGCSSERLLVCGLGLVV